MGKQVSVRLTDEVFSQLEGIMEREDVNRSRAVSLAIENYACDTSDTNGDMGVSRDDELVSQLRDEVAHLREALTQAQAVAAVQAQAIQAQSQKLLSDGEKKHWWQFWKS